MERGVGRLAAWAGARGGQGREQSASAQRRATRHGRPASRGAAEEQQAEGANNNRNTFALGEGRQRAAGAAMSHAGTELGLKALQPGQRKEKECHHCLCLHHFLVYLSEFKRVYDPGT